MWMCICYGRFVQREVSLFLIFISKIAMNIAQSIFDKKLNLIDVLPFSKEMIIHSNKEIIGIIDLLCFFLKKLKNSIQYFYCFQSFSQFDAQVGENSCQIRACQLLYLYRQYRENHLTIDKEVIFEILKIENKKKSLEAIRISYYEQQRIGKRFKKCSLSDFFNVNQIDMEFTQGHSTLFLYHFLTYFSKRDKEGILICVHHEKLCQEMGVSKTLGWRIIHHFQKLASAFSSLFILYLAETVKSASYLNPLIKHLLKRDEEKRFILPCYFLSQVIWHYLLEMKEDILLVVDKKIEGVTIDRFFFLFRVSSIGRFEFLAEIDKSDVSVKPAFIIRGSFCCKTEKRSKTKTEFIQRIKNEGLEAVILTNQAAHPQYAGKKLESFKNDPFFQIQSSSSLQNYNDLIRLFNGELSFSLSGSFEKQELNKYAIELELMRTKANILGCNIENNTLFLITHVMFDNIENILHSLDTYGIYLSGIYELGAQ